MNLFKDEYSYSGVSRVIDEYIGEFGLAVDAWKTNMQDYTGYQTEYESSTHLTEGGISSEVVGYEGAFYPPAVEELVCAYTDPDTHVFESLYMSIYDGISRDSYGNSVLSSFDGKTNYSFDDIFDKLQELFGKYLPGYSMDTFVDNFLSDEADPRQFYGYIDISKISVAVSAIPDTFYGKYYSHLDLTESHRMHIAGQVSAYGSKIYDICRTRDEDERSGVYDIYRYGRDVYKNHLILYKRYPASPDSGTTFEYFKDVTAKKKRNTLGELWIRYHNHPMAFPAITPVGSEDFSWTNIQLSSQSEQVAVSDQVLQLGFDDDKNPKYIPPDGNAFYDFEISRGGSYILLVEKSYLDGGEHTTYDTANVKFQYLNWIYDSVLDRQYLAMSTRKLVDGQIVQFNTDLFASIGILNAENHERFFLVGVYNTQNDVSKIVYLNLTDEGRRVGDTCAIASASGRIATVSPTTDNEQIIDEPLGRYVVPDNAIRDLVTYSAYETDGAKCLDIIVATKSNEIDSCKSLNDGSQRVDRISNSEYEPNIVESHDKYTSHDIFEGDLCIQKFVDDIEDGIGMRFNTNSDMSYIPVYPGDKGRFINTAGDNPDPTRNYYSFQLLGRSNNLDSMARLASFKFDPNITEEKLNSYVYGRVYEDFPGVDKFRTFKMYQNPTFQDITKNNTWTIPLIGDQAFDKDDVGKLSLVLFNPGCGGKNHYYVGRATKIFKHKVNYDRSGEISAVNEIDVKADGIDVGGECGIGGTFSLTKKYSRNEINYIYGVENLELAYNPDNCTLTVKFIPEDPTTTTSVPQGSVVAAVFSKHILDQFEYYHLFDRYGIVRADSLTYKDNVDESWTIHYMGADRIDVSSVIGDIKSYVEMKHHFGDEERTIPQYLKNIDLSRYNYLSDVYVLSPNLSGHHMEMSFKYDEEVFLNYDNVGYFYPSLNTTYPFSIGEEFERDIVYNKYGKTVDQQLEEAFGQDNTYVIQLDRSSLVLSTLGTVQVPVVPTDDSTLLAYEDYNDISADTTLLPWDGTYEPNSTKYPEGNQNLADFLVADLPDGISGTYSYSNPYEYDFVDGPYALSNGYFPGEILVLSQESGIESQGYRYVSVSDFQNVNLDELLRIYVNYRKEGDKMILFFNYNNLLDPPFWKMSDGGYPTVTTIGDSYLRLEPGENGFLNIYLQFRYYENGNLRGCSTGRVLGYQIYNISDDKPKFVIKRTSIPTMEFSRGDAELLQENSISVLLDKKVVDFDSLWEQVGYESTPVVSTDFNVRIYSENHLTGTLELDLEYNGQLLECMNFDDFKTGEDETYSPGFLHMVFKPDEYGKTVRFRFKVESQDVSQYKNRTYPVIASGIRYSDPSYYVFSNVGTVMLAYADSQYLFTEDNTVTKSGDPCGNMPVATQDQFGNNVFVEMTPRN